MTSRLERLNERWRNLPPEYFERLDAEARTREADPDYVPEPVEWRDDGPDPFGMSWAWADDSKPEELER